MTQFEKFEKKCFEIEKAQKANEKQTKKAEAQKSNLQRIKQAIDYENLFNLQLIFNDYQKFVRVVNNTKKNNKKLFSFASNGKNYTVTDTQIKHFARVLLCIDTNTNTCTAENFSEINSRFYNAVKAGRYGEAFGVVYRAILADKQQKAKAEKAYADDAILADSLEKTLQYIAQAA